MIGTTLLQSRKLLELGIDPKTADMCWSNASVRGVKYTDAFELVPKTKEHLEEIFNEAYHDWNKFWELVPAWSLEALLELMPSVIKRRGKRMFLTLEKAGAYNLYYKSPDRLDEIWFTKEKIIDAAFEMIAWLKEQEEDFSC